MAIVGIVGLGPMGAALLRALDAAGIEVVGHDRDVSRHQQLVGSGRPMPSIPGLARECEVVITCLPDEEAVRGVVTSLAGDLAAGAWVVDTSTCGPPLAHELSALLRPRGVTFLDAPVSRAAPRSTVYAGGAEGGLGPVARPLEAISREIVYCGALGRGYALKLLNQVVKYGRFVAAGEAIRIASRLGIAPEVAVSGLLSGTGAAAGLGTAEEQILGRDEDVERHAPTSTIVKDVALARRLLDDERLECTSFEPLDLFFQKAADGPWLDQPYPRSLALLETSVSEERADADPY